MQTPLPSTGAASAGQKIGPSADRSAVDVGQTAPVGVHRAEKVCGVPLEFRFLGGSNLWLSGLLERRIESAAKNMRRTVWNDVIQHEAFNRLPTSILARV